MSDQAAITPRDTRQCKARRSRPPCRTSCPPPRGRIATFALDFRGNNLDNQVSKFRAWQCRANDVFAQLPVQRRTSQ